MFETRGQGPYPLDFIKEPESEGLRELVDTKTLAVMLSVKEKTVRDWCFKREIPFVKLGKLVRFHLPTIRAWYNGRTVKPIEDDIVREPSLDSLSRL